jgi:fatty-acyl-CoA synthase
MPLTGVGKVFKPQLRRDAARRVFTGVLTPLTDKGIDCKVQVGPHGSHGSIANITIANVAKHERDAVAGQIDALLAPFVMRHEIEFVCM